MNSINSMLEHITENFFNMLTSRINKNVLLKLFHYAIELIVFYLFKCIFLFIVA